MLGLVLIHVSKRGPWASVASVAKRFMQGFSCINGGNFILLIYKIAHPGANNSIISNNFANKIQGRNMNNKTELPNKSLRDYA